MSQIKKLINQKFLEGIDSTKFHVAQNGAIMAKDSSGSMIEFLKVNSENKGVVLGKVISTKDEVDQLIADLAQEILDRQAGDVDAKAYADQKIADLVNGAPALLDTLKELADAIGNDENFAVTIASQIGQLQSDLAAEIARAQAAEMALEQRLDAVEPKVSTLETEMDEAQADIVALEGRMSTAESDINAVEASVSAVQSELDAVDGRLVDLEDDHYLLAGEVADLSDDLLLEVERAEAAESALDARLDAVEPKVSTLEMEMDQAQSDISSLQSGLSQEILDRQSGDSSTLSSAQSYADAAVLVEKTRAEGVESSLQSQITTEKARVDAILDASQADKDSFAEIVSLINSVDLENDNAFASVVLDLQNADAALDSRLDAVEPKVISLESRMNTAESDIDSLESDKADKSYVDTQDNALDARLDAMEAMAFYKESKQVESSDLSYIDLAKEAKPYSIKVYVGRLALHEGQDFFVSVEAGKSRLTWMNDFMVGGSEEIEEGMKLFFEYYC